MNLIVNVAHQWAIGKDGNLLAHIKTDMKFFKEKTMHHVVVMGRKTLESFPGQKPLPDRVNIVITRNMEYQKEGVMVVHSIEEALKECEKYSSEDIYIIGGETIYRQMLPYCDTAYVTKMDADYDADTYFPNLDEEAEWECTYVGESQPYAKGTFCFTTYKKKM